LSYYEGPNPDRRDFKLARLFDIDLMVADKSLSRRYVIHNPILKKLSKINPNKDKKYWLYDGRDATVFYREIFDLQDACLDGYWQNIDYFSGGGVRLRQELKFNECVDCHNCKYDDILARHYAVSLHVRRGDYIGNSSFYPLCDSDYYLNAVRYFQERYEDVLFVVFSDDIKWAKENFVGTGYFFVDREFEDSDLADFVLMSKCRSNIIANSTFSWWSAWLNLNLDKVVLSPDVWFSGAQPDNLIPESWVIIPH